MPSKRVAMVSRKVFWGARRPLITGILRLAQGHRHRPVGGGGGKPEVSEKGAETGPLASSPGVRPGGSGALSARSCQRGAGAGVRAETPGATAASDLAGAQTGSERSRDGTDGEVRQRRGALPKSSGCSEGERPPLPQYQVLS